MGSTLRPEPEGQDPQSFSLQEAANRIVEGQNADGWFGSPNPAINAPDSSGKLEKLLNARRQPNPENINQERQYFPFPLGLRMVFQIVEVTKAPIGAQTSLPDAPSLIDIKRGKGPTFYVRPNPGEEQTQRGGLPKVAEFIVNQLPGGSEAAKEVKQEIIYDIVHLVDTLQTNSQGQYTLDAKENAKHTIDSIASKLKRVCGASPLHSSGWHRAIDKATMAEQVSLAFLPPTP